MISGKKGAGSNWFQDNGPSSENIVMGFTVFPKDLKA